MLPIVLIVVFGILAVLLHRSPRRHQLAPIVWILAVLFFSVSAALRPDTRRSDLFFAALAVGFLLRERRARSKGAAA